MKHRSLYIFLQLVILILPALIAAILFNVNDWIDNPFTEYLYYLLGITGLISLGWISELLSNSVSESIVSLLSIFIYIFLAIWVLTKFYSAKIYRIVLVSIINGWLSIWSVIVGYYFMFLSMQ